MKIANIVSVVTLSSPLDLALINERIPQTDFPRKSSWLKMRLPPNNLYIAFYKSGKFLLTTKDPEKIPIIAEEVLKLLHKNGFDVEIVNIKIHNIVVQTTISLNKPLEGLIANLDPQKAEFEPEQFPALVYKDWGVSFLLFSTGKVIVAGLKNFEDAEPIIMKFKKVISVE
jgi:transcription initiation factor TFIID TATA-box-binding protein